MIKFRIVYETRMYIQHYGLTSDIILDDIETLCTELNIERTGSLLDGEPSNLFKLLCKLSCTYDIVIE